MKASTLRFALTLPVFTLSLATGLHAQTTTQPPAAESRPDAKQTNADPNRAALVGSVLKTYFLENAVQEKDANEIQIALRNMLDPRVRIYLVASQYAIVLTAPPDQQRLAQQLIESLDRPRKACRLTYTLAESDAGKRVGIQHYSLIAVIGQHTSLKEGSKIPVMTGTYTPEGSSSVTQQFQYLDIGMNFDVNLDQYANGVRLQTKVEQSSVAEDKPIGGVVEPIIRQTVLQGTAFLTPNKPQALGSIDVVGTTRRIDVEVMMEPLP
jgi:type II secretory pathway component GspD/PulD (secretin)